MAPSPGLLGLCLVAAGCSGPAQPPPVQPAEVVVPTSRPTRSARRGDPARVAGRWDYRTRSNCGRVNGIGEVFIRWKDGARRYAERGYVYWTDSKTKIDWWGEERFESEGRQLVGKMRNSLGDQVEARWRLEGDAPGPERLVVHWQQTNGCKGQGIATRPGGLLTLIRVRRLIAQLDDEDEGLRASAARALGDLGTVASPAILPLVAALKDQSMTVRRAATEALAALSR